MSSYQSTHYDRYNYRCGTFCREQWSKYTGGDKEHYEPLLFLPLTVYVPRAGNSCEKLHEVGMRF